jgi:hypothetical protein
VITTPDLIESLAADAAPVKPLRPPLLRAGLWLGLGLAILTILGVFAGLRSDLSERLLQSGFDAGLFGAVLTAVTAALAAFLLSLPDRSRTWALLPLPALILWMSTLGYQCLTDWVSLGPDGLRLGESADCFIVAAVTSLPLLAALLVMLRPAAPLKPTGAIIMGSLAVAAITATAHSLLHIHEQDSTLIILFWNLGLALVIVAAGTLLGGRLFALKVRQP